MKPFKIEEDKHNYDDPYDILDNYRYVPRPRKEEQQFIDLEGPFDAKLEAKKLVAAWKRTEKEAEMIKQKATSKKENPISSVKALQSKTKIDPKSLIAKTKKTIEVNQKLANEKRMNSTKSEKETLISEKPKSTLKSTGFKDQKSLVGKIEGNSSQANDNSCNVKSLYIQNMESEIRKMNIIMGIPNKVLEQEPDLYSQGIEDHSLEYSDSLISHEFPEDSVRMSEGLRTEWDAKENLYNLSNNPISHFNQNNRRSSGTSQKRNEPEWARMPFVELSQGDEWNNDITGMRSDLMNLYELDQQKIGRMNERINYKEKKKPEDVLANLQKEHEETKLALYKFLFDKLSTKLQRVLEDARLREKALAFTLIAEKLQEEKMKVLKVDLVRQLKTKSLCFCLWVAFVREIKLEKAQEKLKAKEEREKVKLKKAEDFHKKALLKKYFVRGMAKHYFKAMQEKNLQRSKNRVKSAVSSFINRLKSQTDGNNKDSENKKQNVNKKECGADDYDSDFENIPEDKQSETYSSKTEKKESSADIRDARGDYGEQLENYEGEIVKGKEESEQISSYSSSKGFTSIDEKNAGNSKLSKQAKLAELEEKAKQRKEKQELIKKKHEDIKAKKEQERLEAEMKEKEEIKRRKIEEKEAYEKRKREELEAQERMRREQEIQAQKIMKAISFYNTGLLKKYGTKAMKRALELKKANLALADRFCHIRLMKLAFETWGQAMILIAIEDDLEIAPKREIADKYYEAELKKRGFKGLRGQLEERNLQSKAYGKYRENHLQKRSFVNWRKSIPELKKEKLAYEEAYDKMISQFRYRWVTKRVLACLNTHAQETTKEKIKNQHRELMWNKVSSWLSDYKSKKQYDDDFDKLE